MTGSATPQYMKTSDTEVLEAIGKIRAAYSTFAEYVRTESVRLTGEEGHTGQLGGMFTGRVIVGVHARFADHLPGQWKKPDRGLVEPFKNNPIRKEWKERAHPYMPVPGRRQNEWGHDYMGPGLLFVHDGVAYSGYGFIPRDPAVEGVGLWEEIRPSEFMAAAEAYNDEIEEEER